MVNLATTTKYRLFVSQPNCYSFALAATPALWPVLWPGGSGSGYPVLKRISMVLDLERRVSIVKCVFNCSNTVTVHMKDRETGRICSIYQKSIVRHAAWYAI